MADTWNISPEKKKTCFRIVNIMIDYCWSPGDTKSQDTSNHVIDLVCPDYSSFSLRKVNSLSPGEVYRHNLSESSSFQITACHLFGTCHGPLARYVKLRVRMRRECRERFPRHRRWAIPTCITARAWRTCRDACRDRQLSVSFEIGGGGKRSRHSRRMRNLQFYVSGKRSIT